VARLRWDEPVLEDEAARGHASGRAVGSTGAGLERGQPVVVVAVDLGIAQWRTEFPGARRAARHRRELADLRVGDHPAAPHEPDFETTIDQRNAVAGVGLVAALWSGVWWMSNLREAVSGSE